MQSGDHIPRYAQPMDVEPAGPTCGECAFYKEFEVRMPADGSVHLVGACVYEVFKALMFDEMLCTPVVWAEPDDDACRNFKEA